jgi:hypothetical protein
MFKTWKDEEKGKETHWPATKGDPVRSAALQFLLSSLAALALASSKSGSTLNNGHPGALTGVVHCCDRTSEAMRVLHPIPRSLQIRESYVEISRFLHGRTSQTRPLASAAPRPHRCLPRTTHRSLHSNFPLWFRSPSPVLQADRDSQPGDDVPPAENTTREEAYQDLFSTWSKFSTLRPYRLLTPLTTCSRPKQGTHHQFFQPSAPY